MVMTSLPHKGGSRQRWINRFLKLFSAHLKEWRYSYKEKQFKRQEIKTKYWILRPTHHHVAQPEQPKSDNPTFSTQNCLVDCLKVPSRNLDPPHQEMLNNICWWSSEPSILYMLDGPRIIISDLLGINLRIFFPEMQLFLMSRLDSRTLKTVLDFPTSS